MTFTVNDLHGTGHTRTASNMVCRDRYLFRLAFRKALRKSTLCPWYVFPRPFIALHSLQASSPQPRYAFITYTDLHVQRSNIPAAATRHVLDASCALFYVTRSAIDTDTATKLSDPGHVCVFASVYTCWMDVISTYTKGGWNDEYLRVFVTIRGFSR